jgi:hypothetical protein
VDKFAVFFLPCGQSDIEQGYNPNESLAEVVQVQIKGILDHEFAYLTQAVQSAGLCSELADLQNALSSVHSIITAKTARTLRILWIADCLYLDIQSFLVAPLAAYSLSIKPDFVTSKNPVELYERTAALIATKSYDAIFYCPFSYEQSSGFARLLNAKHAASNFLPAKSLANDEFSNVESILCLLCEKTECPIFIHNASGAMRHLNGWKEVIKDILTRPSRILFCSAINSRLENLSCRLNATHAVGQTIVIDEFAIVKANGLASAGSYIHHYGLQHPARLGRYISSTYLDALVTIDKLLGKKLIVCDLDDTLWKGPIGEGAVEHYLDRQPVLKSLRDKGLSCSQSFPKMMRPM